MSRPRRITSDFYRYRDSPEVARMTMVLRVDA